MLVCPQGGCMPYTQFDSCKWATVPSHAVVVNPSVVDLDTRDKIRTLFTNMRTTPAFQNMFFKTAAGSVVNPGDLVFKSSTYVWPAHTCTTT